MSLDAVVQVPFAVLVDRGGLGGIDGAETQVAFSFLRRCVGDAVKPTVVAKVARADFVGGVLVFIGGSCRFCWADGRLTRVISNSLLFAAAKGGAFLNPSLKDDEDCSVETDFGFPNIATFFTFSCCCSTGASTDASDVDVGGNDGIDGAETRVAFSFLRCCVGDAVKPTVVAKVARADFVGGVLVFIGGSCRSCWADGRLTRVISISVLFAAAKGGAFLNPLLKIDDEEDCSVETGFGFPNIATFFTLNCCCSIGAPTDASDVDIGDGDDGIDGAETRVAFFSFSRCCVGDAVKPSVVGEGVRADFVGGVVVFGGGSCRSCWADGRLTRVISNSLLFAAAKGGAFLNPLLKIDDDESVETGFGFPNNATFFTFNCCCSIGGSTDASDVDVGGLDGINGAETRVAFSFLRCCVGEAVKSTVVATGARADLVGGVVVFVGGGCRCWAVLTRVILNKLLFAAANGGAFRNPLLKIGDD